MVGVVKMFMVDLSWQELLAALESLRAGRVLAALAEGALLVVLHDLGTTPVKDVNWALTEELAGRLGQYFQLDVHLNKCS